MARWVVAVVAITCANGASGEPGEVRIDATLAANARATLEQAIAAVHPALSAAIANGTTAPPSLEELTVAQQPGERGNLFSSTVDRQLKPWARKGITARDIELAQALAPAAVHYQARVWEWQWCGVR